MKILAITACTAGVAHTYMAAKNLENKAKARGIDIKVEKQGANGLDGRFTKQDLEEAEGIIFATDVGVAEMERFDGMPSVQGKVKDGIKNADAMIDALEQKIAAAGGAKKTTSSAPASDNAFVDKSDNSGPVMGFLKQWYTGALSGVSHIIPLVIIGGLCVGLLNLFFGYDYTHLYNLTADQIADKEFMAEFATTTQGIVHYLYYIALKAFNPLLICVLAAFTAYGMVGKPGLAPGFMGGFVAVGGGFGKLAVVSGGFIGGLVAGAAAALFVMLIRQIKVPAVLESVKMIVITPLVAGVLTILFMLVGPGKFFAFLDTSI